MTWKQEINGSRCLPAQQHIDGLHAHHHTMIIDLFSQFYAVCFIVRNSSFHRKITYHIDMVAYLCIEKSGIGIAFS